MRLEMLYILNMDLWLRGGVNSFSIENADVYDIEVNHMSGQFFQTKNPGKFNTVTWIDTDCSIQFDISGAYSYVDILHMAESVSLGKTTK